MYATRRITNYVSLRAYVSFFVEHAYDNVPTLSCEENMWNGERGMTDDIITL